MRRTYLTLVWIFYWSQNIVTSQACFVMFSCWALLSLLPWDPRSSCSLSEQSLAARLGEELAMESPESVHNSVSINHCNILFYIPLTRGSSHQGWARSPQDSLLRSPLDFDSFSFVSFSHPPLSSTMTRWRTSDDGTFYVSCASTLTSFFCSVDPLYFGSCSSSSFSSYLFCTPLLHLLPKIWNRQQEEQCLGCPVWWRWVAEEEQAAARTRKAAYQKTPEGGAGWIW